MPEEKGWHFKVRRARNGVRGYLAWAAHIPELGDGPLDIDPREDVLFAFGATAKEALNKLRRELGSYA